MPKNVPGVMHEFKHGQLHSGSSRGPKVTDPKQAIAIALNEQRDLKRNGGDVPKGGQAAMERPSMAALRTHGSGRAHL